MGMVVATGMQNWLQQQCQQQLLPMLFRVVCEGLIVITKDLGTMKYGF
jgi:hypothetical protein